MSTTLNHSTLVQLVQFVASIAASVAARKSASSEAAITARARVEEAEIDAEIRALEIHAARDESRQKIAVISEIIAACRHIEDRKFDLVTEAFRATHALLLQQQAALLDERKVLAQQKAELPKAKLLQLKTGQNFRAASKPSTAT